MTWIPKAGDVVLYGIGGHRKFSEAIVSGFDETGDQGAPVMLNAWRHSHVDDRWVIGDGRLKLDQIEPHPEPDKILAEFAAYCLLGKHRAL